MAETVLQLASSSPRRRALLAAAGISFVTVAPGAEPEADDVADVAGRARRRARAKAVGAACAGGFVLGADTVVEVAGREIGKPADADAARAALELLQGRSHRVHTGHCLVRKADGAYFEETVSAVVRFEPLDPGRIDAFVARGSWEGKAGAYGLQDDVVDFAVLEEGPEDTVIGLHVAAVRRLLAAAEAPEG